MSLAKRLSIAFVGIVAVSALSGCFSFAAGGMIAYDHGITAGTVTIFRHPSRDLAFFSKSQPTMWKRGRAAAGILNSAAQDLAMPGVIRDRWNAATAEDQYSDIGEDIPDLWGHSRCLAMNAKLGWGNIGYNWYTIQRNTGQCRWGDVDPVPTVP